MTLYITGGHLTPALAVIDDLIKQKDDVRIRFIGRELSQTSTNQPSRERVEMENRQIPFIPITAAKFHRTHVLDNVFEVIKFPISLWEVVCAYRSDRPDVILSFGGYLAFPACLAGKFFGARVITHEQTRVAGLANQVIGWFANVVAVAHPDSIQYFFPSKVVVTGNPIREALFREYKTPPSWCGPGLSTKPLIYITGGSQGSAVINQTIATLLPKLVRDYALVHQCGSSAGSQVFKDLEIARLKLPEEFRERYVVREWIEEKEVSYLLRAAQFVISRAGANTVLELTVAKTPAIFIPLPFAYKDEQYKNAAHLSRLGAAIVIHQKDLLPDTLMSAIMQMSMHYSEYKNQMILESSQLIKNGTLRLRRLIFQSNISDSLE